MFFLPIALLLVNFFLFSLGLLLSLLSPGSFQKHFFKLPVFIQKLFPIIAVGPLFISPLLPQDRFILSNFLSLPIGSLLFVLGWILIISAFFKIGVIPSLREKSNLITSGVYRLVRHPIYSGTIISVLGWTILLKSIISIFYFPIMFLLYFLTTILEEKGLIEDYGDEYLNYKLKVTKRLLPFIF
jgi:protein-S-isoprenylcysteine O-methyltransferase Ste14